MAASCCNLEWVTFGQYQGTQSRCGKMFSLKTISLLSSVASDHFHNFSPPFLHFLMTEMTRNINLVDAVCYPLVTFITMFTDIFWIHNCPSDKIQNYWSIHKYLWWKRGTLTLTMSNLAANNHIIRGNKNVIFSRYLIFLTYVFSCLENVMI